MKDLVFEIPTNVIVGKGIKNTLEELKEKVEEVDPQCDVYMDKVYKGMFLFLFYFPIYRYKLRFRNISDDTYNKIKSTTDYRSLKKMVKTL
jgi:hypothetical protein